MQRIVPRGTPAVSAIMRKSSKVCSLFEKRGTSDTLCPRKMPCPSSGLQEFSDMLDQVILATK